MRPSLRQVFYLALAGLALLLGALLTVVLGKSGEAVLQGADRYRQEKAIKIGDAVADHVGRAHLVVQRLETAILLGAVKTDDDLAVEAALFSAVATDPALEEATLTRARGQGEDADGALLAAPEGRAQISVLRLMEGRAERLVTRRTAQKGGAFESALRNRAPGGALTSTPFEGSASGEDPTQHITFRAAAGSWNRGSAISSDLHYAECDSALPESERRVVVTVQKAIWRGAEFLGVLRVGLLTEGIDRRLWEEADRDRPHRIFLCDAQGRLISRLRASDRVEPSGDDLRVTRMADAPEVAAALAAPSLKQVDAEHPRASAMFRVGETSWVGTWCYLPGTQDWVLGIVAPEAHYLKDLEATRRELLKWSVALIALILIGGVIVLRAVQGGIAHIDEATRRMERFEFASMPVAAPFSDVAAVLERLEQANTALRALGKYVPIGLVRLLYGQRREPHLGGEMAEVSLMFTDIKDFTTLSEQLPPDALAATLGRYLEVMTTSIQATGGIIDKYIGDAVMAIWNAPIPIPDHPVRACRAALDCVKAVRALMASPEWAGRPRLVTRFGLHRDTVMVGHFGAPDRMSYTALGDGVNLASRLEGLNKQYGTTILVSEAMAEAARGAFTFRRLDRVAVKGKARGIDVHELLEEPGPDLIARVQVYEDALRMYWDRDFAGAVARLEPQAEVDPPSRALLGRCRAYLADPPPADWDGVYVSKSK